MARPETKLAKELERKGWSEVRRSKHSVWRCGCGEHPQFVMATTIGRGRGVMNAAVFLASTERFGECAIDKRKVLG